jgi:hypothetical protein
LLHKSASGKAQNEARLATLRGFATPHGALLGATRRERGLVALSVVALLAKAASLGGEARLAQRHNPPVRIAIVIVLTGPNSSLKNDH